MSAVAAQSAMEFRLTIRRGESLLVTLAIPVGVLIVFSKIEIANQPLDVLVPGVLALAVIATSMVSLGIATGFERRYNVLKRLASTPLSRRGIVMAKMINIVAIEAIQVVVILAVAMALGWSFAWRVVPALAVLVVGSVAFSGLGLLLAGTLRAEATLALTNLLYLLCIGIGGVVYPIEDLSDGLAAVATVMPSGAFVQSLRAVLDPGSVALGWPLAILIAWAVVLPVLAIRLFRFEE